MKFKKTPPELFEFIAKATMGLHCEPKKMFGGVGYFVNGNMFTGVHQDDLFLRLSKEDQERLMKEYDEVTGFEPMPGRRMTEYVAVPESVFSNAAMIEKWLKISYTYASLLPPKKKTPRKRTK